MPSQRKRAATEPPPVRPATTPRGSDGHSRGKVRRTEAATQAAKEIAIAAAAEPAVTVRGNYVVESQKGCFVTHGDRGGWLLSHGPYDPAAFGLDEDETPPDLAVDPETMTLSIINPSTATLSYFVTVDHPVLIGGAAADGAVGGVRGVAAAADGREPRPLAAHPAPVTFVVVLGPKNMADVCQIDVAAIDEDGPDFELRVSSDVKNVAPCVDTQEFDPARTYRFPLGPGGPYLCSQGFGGEFTHFYPGTFHAVDFECPVGTAVLAVGNGSVVEVDQEHAATGCDVSNLFKWNSVMLRLDDGVFVEYVHIRRGSCPLRPGDIVRAGDKICESGDVGFCPTPHLHLQMHVSAAKDAPTIRFALRDSSGVASFPQAGRWYE
mmetsp:Transcript_27374/g.71788  ORF Transcript_27374/g.71788 Transcript_27374/m.71788 type:complete len:379 (+) Transcript_27374:184-1320(+)